MKIGEIMNRAPISVRIDQTFGEAFRLLVDTEHEMIPVVDAEGIYQGNFDLKDIWGVLLPRAARLDRKSIEHLGFVTSSLEKLKERLQDEANEAVSKYVTRHDLPTLSPDSQLVQAIHMLDECRETLPVVEPKTLKLVGILAASDILKALR